MKIRKVLDKKVGDVSYFKYLITLPKDIVENSRLLEKDLVLPAYDYCLKSSHAFNLLDARGAISVAERTRFIGRVRDISRKCAEGYLKKG